MINYLKLISPKICLCRSKIDQFNSLFFLSYSLNYLQVGDETLYKHVVEINLKGPRDFFFHHSGLPSSAEDLIPSDYYYFCFLIIILKFPAISSFISLIFFLELLFFENFSLYLNYYMNISLH